MTDRPLDLDRVRYLKMRIEKILAVQKAHTQDMKTDIKDIRQRLNRTEKRLEGER